MYIPMGLYQRDVEAYLRSTTPLREDGVDRYTVSLSVVKTMLFLLQQILIFNFEISCFRCLSFMFKTTGYPNSRIMVQVWPDDLPTHMDILFFAPTYNQRKSPLKIKKTATFCHIKLYSDRDLWKWFKCWKFWVTTIDLIYRLCQWLLARSYCRHSRQHIRVSGIRWISKNIFLTGNFWSFMLLLTFETKQMFVNCSTGWGQGEKIANISGLFRWRSHFRRSMPQVEAISWISSGKNYLIQSIAQYNVIEFIEIVHCWGTAALCCHVCYFVWVFNVTYSLKVIEFIPFFAVKVC